MAPLCQSAFSLACCSVIVRVAVVEVGIVRMLVAHRCVMMPVRMRLAHRPVMVVLMMFVMNVAVFVIHGLVVVHVGMTFRQMHPETKAH